MGLDATVAGIEAPDERSAAAAQRAFDVKTKPRGSLGRLEELARRLAIIRGGPPSVGCPVIFTFAGDHGVVAEGVSAYPQSVTAQMVANFLRGGAAVNVLARDAGARLVVADFGLALPPPRSTALVDCRLGAGTANMCRGPAMTRDQAIASVEAGARLAEDAIAEGADLLGTGEMGIGNSTAAAAITASIVGIRPEAVTGRGTGIDDVAWRRKVEVVGRALTVNRPNPLDGVDVLAKVGGFEIGGLAGVMLAGASRRVPVVVDGFIATSAALIAVSLAPAAREMLFGSHRSAEPGHAYALKHLGLTPYLDLSMRLGEGTGAALFIHLARAAARIYAEMATFESAGVDGPGEALGNRRDEEDTSQ